MSPSITIHGEIHSSKNSRRIMRSKSGAPFISKSRRSKEDEGIFAVQFYNQRETWEEMIKGHEFPITLVFFFRRATKHKFDYVNIAQGILDAMVKAEYLPDDSADYVIPAFLPYVVDKENPGCELTIKTTDFKKALSKFNPLTETYQGNIQCVFCGSFENERHQEDCLWLLAKQKSE